MRAYSIRSSSLLNVCVALGVVGAISVGCADEDKGSAAVGNGGTSSAGRGGSGAVGKGGASSTGGNGNGSPVSYEVPMSGGMVEVPLESGDSITFEFPASAGG